MKKLYILTLFIGLFFGFNPVYSATATFQHGVNGYFGGEDLEISDSAPNTNYSSGGGIYSDRMGVRYCGSQCNKILLRFGNLGISGTITNVKLELKQSSQQSSASNYLYAKKVSRSDWSVSQTTWNTYKTGSNWSTPGGDTGSALFTTSAIGSGTITFDLGGNWTVSELQQNGIVIDTDIPGYNYVWFYSNESGSVSDRPKLIITYDGAEPISPTTPTTPTTPQPTVVISASPTSIQSGNTSTLTWSSTNATSCTASGAWSGTRSTSGTLSVSPTTTSTYTLSCTGTGGSANASTVVSVSTATPTTPPVITTPTTVIGNGLKIDLSYVNQNSPEFIRFKGVVDAALAGNPDYGFSGEHAALMYKITGDVRYADYAIGFIENCQNSRYAEANCGVQGAEAAIAAGGRPPVSGDSYLEVGDIIGSLALVYDWAGPRMTQSQKNRWAAYANQTIYNVWNPNQATWGGRSYPWTGWSINNPGNNYYYSFVQASMYWALASNDTTLLSFVRNQKLQPLLTYFSALPGGGSLEGTGYGTAHMRLFHLYQVWKDSTGEDLANANSHLTDSIRLWLHQTTPNRSYYAPIGDLSRSSFPDLFDYHRRLVLEARNLTNNNSAKETASWWLNNISVTQMSRRIDSQWDLLPKGTNTNSSPNESLSYYASGIGRVFARTGWDTNALWMNFVAGKYNESHAHHDQGSFTLANNTFLAVTNNIYSASGINQTSDYHNVLRFTQNGSIVPQREGTESRMTLNQLSANGEIDVTGNITPAYGGNSAVQSWVRNVKFAGRKLTVNDSFSVGPGTQATFQVHVPVQPVINGNTITAGDLRIRVLVPSNPTITVVNQGRYRIDINGGTNQYVVELSDEVITGNPTIPNPPTTPTTPTTPQPTVVISASPTSIQSGNTSTLTWSSTNATSCTASGAWSGTRSTSGTLSVSPTTTSTYTLSCTGTGGSANASTLINVSVPTPTTPPSTLFTTGQRVQTTANVNVRVTPSSTGTLLGTQTINSLGTITGTSVYANNIHWWNVNYDSGVDGYSSEQFLQSYTGPSTPTQPATTTPPVTTPTTPTTPPSGGGGGAPSTPTTPSTGSGGTVSTPSTGTSGTSNTGSGSGGGGGSAPTTPTQPPTPTTNIPKPTLTRTVYLGSKGSDVTSLQTFLISTGYLSPNLNTGYYGNATKEAVQKYQCATLKICSGSETTNGYGVVGAKTRATFTTTPTTSQTTTTNTLSTEQRVVIQKQISDLLLLVQQLMTQLKAIQGN